MVRNVLNAKQRTILPHQKFIRVNARNKDVNECFHIGREIIHKVHANLRLNGQPIHVRLQSNCKCNSCNIRPRQQNGALTKERKERLELKEL